MTPPTLPPLSYPWRLRALVAMARWACADFDGRRVDDPVYQRVSLGQHRPGQSWGYSTCSHIGGLVERVGFALPVNSRAGCPTGREIIPWLTEHGRKLANEADRARFVPGAIVVGNVHKVDHRGYAMTHVFMVLSDDGATLVTADYGQAPMTDTPPHAIGGVLRVRTRAPGGDLRLSGMNTQTPDFVLDVTELPEPSGAPDCEWITEATAWCLRRDEGAPDTDPAPPPSPVLVPDGFRELRAQRPSMRGLDVEVAQECLIRAGFDLPIWGADGSYGSYRDDGTPGETIAAVEAFQRAHSLAVDGVVGKRQTWPALLAYKG